MPEVDFDVNVTDLYDAIYKSDWGAASAAVRSNPIEAETWVVRREADDEGSNNILWRFLPLHSACARRPPSSFVRDLLIAYPPAASFKDMSGMYPLHYACANRASKSVIEQLIECYPQAAKESDPTQQMLPLHYCAQWGPSEDGILELLLDVYGEGVTTINGEGMSPLDLCREANFDGWEEVLMAMKRKTGGSHSNNKLAVSMSPRTHEKESECGDALVSTTIDIRSTNKSPKRTPSRSRRGRPSTLSRAMHDDVEARDDRPSSRPPSRSRKDRPTSQSRNHHLDERDDMRQYEIHGTTPIYDSSRRLDRQQFESFGHSSLESKPQSMMSSLGSPRYHEMKTPKSSGRNRAYSFGQKEGRRVEFGASSRSHESSIASSRMSQPRLSQDREVKQHLSQEREAQQHVVNRLSHENEAQEQVMNHLSQEHDTMAHQVSLLITENSQLHSQLAETQMMQNECAQLRIKLANYERTQHENAQLHAKLASFEKMKNQNIHLHSKLAKLQDIQVQLGAVVDIAERRENARMNASAERRKMLLELLAAEDKHDQSERSNFLYKGDTLGRGFDMQIKELDLLRAEMLACVVTGGAPNRDAGPYDQPY